MLVNLHLQCDQLCVGCICFSDQHRHDSQPGQPSQLYFQMLLCSLVNSQRSSPSLFPLLQDSMKSLLSYIVAYYLRHFDEVSLIFFKLSLKFEPQLCIFIPLR